MRAPASAEWYANARGNKLCIADQNRESTDREVSGDLPDIYSNTNHLIDAQAKYQAQAIADLEAFIAEMANILALLETSARTCPQCPREILCNLIRDPEDALRREICRT